LRLALFEDVDGDSSLDVLQRYLDLAVEDIERALQEEEQQHATQPCSLRYPPVVVIQLGQVQRPSHRLTREFGAASHRVTALVLAQAESAYDSV